MAAAWPEEAQQPSMDDMIPRQGSVSGLFGLRTRSFGTGGRRGAVLRRALPFGGGISSPVLGWGGGFPGASVARSEGVLTAGQGREEY